MRKRRGGRRTRRLLAEPLEDRRLLAELIFDTSLTSLNLAGGPFLMPLASDPGNALGDSINGYGLVNSAVTITLSSQRPSNPGPLSVGLACASQGGGTAGQQCGSGAAEPIDPGQLDGQPFRVTSFFDVFFDITVTDVDPRPGRDFAGQPDEATIVLTDNGPASLQSIYSAIFDQNAPNFGLVPPPEVSPYIGHFNIEIPLGGDINGNGEADKIKFTLATHSVGDENRTFVQLPDGTVLDTFDSAAFLAGAVVDQSADPPFAIGQIDPSTGLPDPAVFGGPTTATSRLRNRLAELDQFPESVGQIQLEVPAPTTVVTPSAALPPLEAVYVTAEDVHATFHGPDLEIILQDVRHRPFADPPPVISVTGVDEQEVFQSSLRATAIVTSAGMGLDHAQIPVEFLGPVTTRVAGKAGVTAGTFGTEMLSMNLAGQIGGQTVLIRESPTRASGGSTSVAQLGGGGGGGGGYQIDSFFDIWVEISVDGGLNWISADGAAHVQAQSVGIQTPSPELPPNDGVYRTPQQVHAEFQAGALQIVLQDAQHSRFTDVVREIVGQDEEEHFQSTVVGVATINGGGLENYTTTVVLHGPVWTRVSDRALSTTGVFDTEMLQLDLTGEVPLPEGGAMPLRIRESPTKASLGRTSVRDLGNGTFHVDSFFDIWTELSLDGGNSWTPSTGSAAVELTAPPIVATVDLVGPTTVAVFFEGAEGQSLDDDHDGRDEVATEMLQLDLRGTSSLGPLVVRLDPSRPTLGQIEEQANAMAGTLDLAPFTPAGTADSFFDVFFEVEVGGQVLHNATAAHLATVISHKPPQDGERYVSAQRLPLLDAAGNLTGLYAVREMSQPAPTIEIDPFAETTAVVELVRDPQSPLRSPPFVLRGPSEVHVYFEGPNHGDAADDDGDGLEEVVTQLVQMNLTDGRVTLRVRDVQQSPGLPSLGGIEEQTNNTPGTLDLPPFTAVGTADSFFDVFFEIELADGSVLHNEQPLRMQAVIDHKPPLARYMHIVPSDGPIELFDAAGNSVGLYVVHAEHYTGFTEVDVFPNSVGQIQVEVPAPTTVVTPSSLLPPLEAVYVTAEDVHATFHGPDLEIILQDVRHRPLADPPPVISVTGADEQEVFQSSLRATAIVTSVGMGLDHARIPVEFLGPVTTRVAGKAGVTAGTFGTEMLSMNLAGQIGGQTVLIRESPTRASGGSTSITQLGGGGGGGGYQIDSFFDIWVEISVDGGLNWIPADGAAHVQAQSVGIQTPSPELPPNDGVYRTPQQVHAEFQAGALQIVLQDVQHSRFANVTREIVGQDEEEHFQSTVVGVATINGGGLENYTTTVVLHGPVWTRVSDRALSQTGVFDTEMLELDLTGEVPLPDGGAMPLRIRESPTKASLGRTSARDLGNGTFHVDSFFDIWTELSLDWGENWTPASSSAAVELGAPPVLETVDLVGPTTVAVFFESAEGRADDDDNDGREEVAIEMLQLDLAGTSSVGPVVVRLDPARRTLGQIEEQVNNTAGTLDVPPFVSTGLADSFFDVFFEIEVGGQVLHSATPAHMAAVISHKPPAPGETYVNPFTQPIALLDAHGNPTGMYLVQEFHTPNPVVNHPPILTPIGPQVVNELDTLTFTVSASDPDLPADTVTFSATDLPSGASFNPATKVFSWTPSETQGGSVYLVTVTVTDSGGLTDSETVSITVNDMEFDFFPYSLGKITLDDGQGYTETVVLGGPSRVAVVIPPSGAAADTDGDGRDQVATELTLLDLRGTSAKFGPLVVTLDPARRSRGEIEELDNKTLGTLDLDPFGAGGLADSFFDVYPLIQAGGLVFHTAIPLHIAAVISHKPPAPGETYADVIAAVKAFDNPACVVPDNGGGTVNLPPEGCEYLSPDEVHFIIAGLPPGTEIELAPIHKDFICRQADGSGSGDCVIDDHDPTNGETEQFGSTLEFAMQGTGMLAGYERTITIPNVQVLVQSGPRTPGDPVQSFDTEMLQLQGQIVGDPEFDLFRVTAGTNFGLPSPGHTTLTRQPSGTWVVDSFFDITYRIDFVGASGGPFAGQSGSTTGTIRMLAAGRGAQLIDPNGNLTGIFVTHEEHTPNPEKEIDVFPNSLAQITVQGPSGTETVTLSGPTTVEVVIPPDGTAADTDGDWRDQVLTEMVQMDLSGSSPTLGPVSVRLDSRTPSTGEIEELANGTPGVLDLPPFTAAGTADSFFDVYFEIEVGGMKLYPARPKHMTSVIDHKPPGKGTVYENLEKIPLVDAAGNPTPYSIVATRHIPVPPTITVVKDTVPDDGRDFTYACSFGPDFLLDDDADPALPNSRTFVLPPGNYSVTELAQPGWTLASVTIAGDNGNSSTAGATANLVLDPWEDLVVTYKNERTLDFGDAPEFAGTPYLYPTLLPNGARHAIVPGLFLGQWVEGDPDGQPTWAAVGDDVGDGTDDEDGVVFTSPLVVGSLATVNVTHTGSGLLSAWMDFNGDGDWGELNEQIFTNLPLSGVNTTTPLTFSVPTGLAPALTYARFRFSTVANLPPWGLARDGEVEDYRVAITAPATITFTVAGSGVSEGTATHHVGVTLTVAGGGLLTSNVSVDVRDSLSGTAAAGFDYIFSDPTPLVFLAGTSSTTQWVPIAIFDDSLPEGDEIIVLALDNLSDPSNQTTIGSPPVHIVTIADHGSLTEWRFDFNGFYGYTAAGYIGVSPFQLKPGSDYGWQTLPPQYFERNWPVSPPYTNPDPKVMADQRLKYDGQSTDYLGTPLTFLVDVAAGRAYDVMILTGDTLWNHDREQFTVQGLGAGGTSSSQVLDTWGAGAPADGGSHLVWGGGVPNPAAGYYRWVHLTAAVGGSSGGIEQLAVTMQDLGGSDPATVILGVDIRAVDRVIAISLTPYGALPADGENWDTYTGSGAPPNTVLTVTGFAPNTPPGTGPDNAHYLKIEGVAPAAADQDVTAFGTQITSDAGGNFSFRALRPSLVTPVTFTVEESSGLARGTMTQTYTAPPGGMAMRFDFGIYGSPAQTGFLPVMPQTIYTATQGYGWQSRVAGVDRKDPRMSALRRDLNYANNATFKVNLPDGTYSVRIYHSNPKYNGTVSYVADNFQVSAEGTPQYTVASIPAGTTDIRTFSVSVSGGALELRFLDLGGQDGNFVVAGIDVSSGALPGEAPLLAAGDPRDEGAAAISAEQLERVAAEAAARWTASGLTATQAATLASVQFAVADLGGAYLGLANPATNTVRIDDDGARIGWSVVSGPLSVVSRQGLGFSGQLGDASLSFLNPEPRTLNPGIDLLTVVLHEIGHLLGYEHTADGLMAPMLGASPLHPSSLILSPASRLDDMFAELGRGGSQEWSPGLPESPDGEVLVAAMIRSSGEPAQARVPRPSRLPRYERELDDCFALLAASDESGI